MDESASRDVPHNDARRQRRESSLNAGSMIDVQDGRLDLLAIASATDCPNRVHPARSARSAERRARRAAVLRLGSTGVDRDTGSVAACAAMTSAPADPAARACGWGSQSTREFIGGDERRGGLRPSGSRAERPRTRLPQGAQEHAACSRLPPRRPPIRRSTGQLRPCCARPGGEVRHLRRTRRRAGCCGSSLVSSQGSHRETSL